MENVIKQCGRFALIHTEQGYCWRLTTPGSREWYWHPGSKHWTAERQWSATEEGASIELDWALTHEGIGDLNEQHLTPPAARPTPRL